MYRDDYSQVKDISIKDQVLHEISRRVDLVVSNVYGAYLSSIKERPVSFYRFFNGLMMLLQKPVTIVIFKEVDNEYCEHIGVDFIVDNQHKYLYEECLRPHYINNSKKIKKKYLYDLYGTGYFFLVLVIDRSLGNEKPVFRFLNKKSYKDFYIRECIGRFVSQDLSKEFIEAIKKSVPIRNVEPSSNDLFVDYDGEDFILSKIHKKAVDDIEGEGGELSKIYESFSGISNKMIRDIAKDSISSVDIGNLCFFTRSYTRDNYRFLTGSSSGYPYDIKMFLTKEQQEVLKDYFKEMDIERYKSGQGRLYRDINCDPKYKSILTSIDEEVWRYMKRNRDRAMTIITSAFGAESKAMSDSVFSSGVIHFRRPFINGGLERVSFPVEKYKTLKGIPIKVKTQLLRLCLTYYALDAMAMKSGARKDYVLSLSLFPIEVYGSIFSTVGYAHYTDRYSENKESEYANGGGREEAFLTILEGKPDWDAKFYFSTYIVSKVERKLRRKLFGKYIRTISGYLDELLKITFGRYGRDLSAQNLQDSLDRLNSYSDYLSRLVPYNPVKLKVQKKQSEVNFFNHNIEIQKEENKFFLGLVDIEQEKGFDVFDDGKLIKELVNVIADCEDYIVKMEYYRANNVLM
ncbi:MAG: hypothetical protein K6L74_17170 [Neptuniibacter sp.]